jgi:hypothetical protein
MLCPYGKLVGWRPVRQAEKFRLEQLRLRFFGGDRLSLGCGGRAFAPEVVGGEAEHEERDGDSKIRELRRVEHGLINRVANDRGGGEHEKKRRPRVAGDAIRNGESFACAT